MSDVTTRRPSGQLLLTDKSDRTLKIIDDAFGLRLETTGVPLYPSLDTEPKTVRVNLSAFSRKLLVDFLVDRSEPDVPLISEVSEDEKPEPDEVDPEKPYVFEHDGKRYITFPKGHLEEVAKEVLDDLGFTPQEWDNAIRSSSDREQSPMDRAVRELAAAHLAVYNATTALLEAGETDLAALVSEHSPTFDGLKWDAVFASRNHTEDA